MARQDAMSLDHVAVFRAAWDSQEVTRCALAPLAVNEVLAARYTVDPAVTFTRTMLWDLEVRKARRPDLFIPRVVAAGSARVWGGDDVFVRASRQRLWLEPERYGLVLERTHLDHERQAVTFIGTGEIPGPDGEILRGTGQALFHVEHSVGGTENAPTNRWRIAHLTGGVDERLVRVFAAIDADPWLPEYVEIYVRDVLGARLERRS